jgi:sarcosine oxidase
MTARARVEVVVIGGGAIGLATARALVGSGREVLVLEQFRLGHDRGSSHGATRIFRLAYDEAEWVRLAQEALPLWRDLEAESGVELLSLSGSLDTGRDPEPICDALQSCDAAFELLEPAAVELRFGIRLREPAVFQPQGGVAWAQRTLSALRGSLDVLEETRAVSLSPSDSTVRVETTKGPIDARAAVVCAGAWARPLLATARLELGVTVTRETVAYFALATDIPFPSVLDWRMAKGWPGVQVYALDGGDGRLKVGLHHAGLGAEPDREGDPDEAAVELAAEWVARTFPLASDRPLGAETCLYTTTVDESFVLERHGPIVVGSACSGHAFKFVPALGVRLAGLAEEALTS